jgi:uncharacterized damage-inducible protein DinB
MGIVLMRERFDYLIETRGRFLETFRSIGWDAFANDRGATWGSMLAIFLHILDVEEAWLQYGARKGTTDNSPDRKVGEYHSFDKLFADNLKVGKDTKSYLETLNDEDLDRVITLKLADGTYQRKVSKILEHAAVDELSHVGEWICLLSQMDVKPPYIDWLDYRV